MKKYISPAGDHAKIDCPAILHGSVISVNDKTTTAGQLSKGNPGLWDDDFDDDEGDY